MTPLVRLLEGVETLVRLASSRLSYVGALERFHKKRAIRSPRSARSILLADEREDLRPTPVSLIVLSLHGAEMLCTLLSSIVRYNSWPDIEILIVDHGGDEHTARVIREAGRSLNIRHLKPGRNFSFAFSCNRAAQIARGDVVVFLNNDIELTQDILPDIVKAARSGKYLVGVKFRYGQLSGRDAQRPQIGIRFRWNERQGWTVPYEAVVEGSSVDLPCEIPAITAAVLGVSRQKMLEMGGFHEHYLYAYEDVDLCLKARTRFGMRSISLNNLSANHMWGATRFKRSSRKRRRDWHRYNMSVFRSRCGYLSRRLAWLGLFDVAGFDWGRDPAIAWIGKDGETATDGGSPAIEAVRADFAGYNLYGYDVVVCETAEIDPCTIRHLGPMTLRVAWLSGSGEDWTSVADFYDVLIAETEATATTAAQRLDRPVHCMRGQRRGAYLCEVLADFIENRFRILVVSRTPTDAMVATVAQLRREGHSVDVRVSIESRGTLRYDVVVWFEPPAQTPAAGTIHVAAHEVAEDNCDVYDICSVPCAGNVETWLTHIVAEIRACHEMLVAGPDDTPLEDVSVFDDADAEMFWRRYNDPTSDLIGDSTRTQMEGG